MKFAFILLDARSCVTNNIVNTKVTLYYVLIHKSLDRFFHETDY